ncbi:glycosyltransferase family 4 protein [Sphingomonas sp. CL5.1]|uniref:glycosyltransferase family 4 protein n=1 Tax=Sphingomonas sp. CL5.1 TaxID=2653203 RepID=UPI0015838786|nr:glycosyltransferase family 4 protein [Sphingomonas sp. CL5.1]QKR99451.1 glycosyltransferase family 4 protein [Sphingomonas sp. CL5.1]
MHIALYSPELPSSGSANGIVTYTRIMQAALKAAGHRATVFDRFGIEHDDGSIEQLGPDSRIAARIGRLRERIVGRSPVRWPVRFRHIIERIHSRHPIDVIEMEESFGFAGRLGLGIPVVTRLHGPHIFGKDEREPPQIARVSAARMEIERQALVGASGITSPSARLLDDTLGYYGISPTRTAFIQNPMPLSGTPWSVEGARTNNLLFIGRFDLRKGADITLRAFALAAKKVDDLSITMCGPDRGITTDDNENIKCKEWINKNIDKKIAGRIKFLGDIDHNTLNELRKIHKLQLSTSRFETFSYSIAESLAVGMPVVMANTYGLAEVVTDRENGFVAPIGDVNAFADAVVAALSDCERLARIGAAGRGLCARLLSPERIAAQTVDFYRTISG